MNDPAVGLAEIAVTGSDFAISITPQGATSRLAIKQVKNTPGARVRQDPVARYRALTADFLAHFWRAQSLNAPYLRVL